MNALEVGEIAMLFSRWFGEQYCCLQPQKEVSLLSSGERQIVGDVGALTTTSQKTDSADNAIGFFMAS